TRRRAGDRPGLDVRRPRGRARRPARAAVRLRLHHARGRGHRRPDGRDRRPAPPRPHDRRLQRPRRDRTAPRRRRRGQAPQSLSAPQPATVKRAVAGLDRLPALSTATSVRRYLPALSVLLPVRARSLKSFQPTAPAIACTRPCRAREVLPRTRRTRISTCARSLSLKLTSANGCGAETSIELSL